METKDNPYLKFSEPNQGCLLALRHIILDFDENITETVKYGAPCFVYKSKIMCYLLVEKKSNSPYILFAEGRYMIDNELESGDRKRMKVFRVNASKDIRREKVVSLLSKAINLYVDGTIVLK